MSGETQVERPEPREDGSYPEPAWEGRWLLRNSEGTEWMHWYSPDKEGPLYTTRSVWRVDGDGLRWYPIPPIPGLDGAAPSEEPEPAPAEPPALKGDHGAVRLAYRRWYRNLRSVNPWTGATNEMVTFFASPEGQAALAAFRGDAPSAQEPKSASWSGLTAGEVVDIHRYLDHLDAPKAAAGEKCSRECQTRLAHRIHKFCDALAAQRDAAQSEVDRLTKERDEARQQIKELASRGQSAQPDAPSIESRLSKVEAAVAKMEGER